ncbi:MAG TPA: LuxR C-terminal-related transcriptional regulator [Sporichthyaceae bacterium]
MAPAPALIVPRTRAAVAEETAPLDTDALLGGADATPSVEDGLIAETLQVDPARLAAMLADAVRSGTPLNRVAARLARAVALTGDRDGALRLADVAVGDPNAADRDLAVAVAAAVLSGRGMLSRAADLHRWFAATSGQQCPAAVPALLGTGDLAGARAAAAPVTSRIPTLGDGVESLVAAGLLDSITGPPTAALSKLTRAAGLLEPAARNTLLPDTPAALAAVVALNVGEFGVAESVLTRAVEVDLGGVFARTRHRVLQAWTAMQRGDLDRARGLLLTDRQFEPREELTAAAIEVGIARREGDLGLLQQAWQRARQAIVRHPVDLYALHAVGELWVGAVRLSEEDWVAPHVAEMWALLDRLGSPPLWAAPMHWYGVQAAGLADRTEAAAPHVAALESAAERYPHAAVLAAAGRCWLAVLAGQIDAAEVDSAARRLHRIGHAWDASRLAGQAAVRAEDRTVMAALLSCARSLRPAPVTDETDELSPVADGLELSDREREVAALLLDGLTYKDIGERLFISAKTVEHHVARIRQRCAAGSRAELFSLLRANLS